MHWLKKYRMDNRLSREQLAAKIRKPARPNKPETGIGCSAVLIEILESGDPKRGITHPEIANRIAEVTGATAEQRDSIVLEKHRGTWQPGKKSAKQPAEKEKKRESAFVKGVVALDKLGNEIGRFRSVREAAERLETSTSVVSSRCLRQIKKVRNEFNALGMTFRHAAEWDRMTSEARAEDMKQIHKGKDE